MTLDNMAAGATEMALRLLDSPGGASGAESLLDAPPVFSAYPRKTERRLRSRS